VAMIDKFVSLLAAFSIASCRRASVSLRATCVRGHSREEIGGAGGIEEVEETLAKVEDGDADELFQLVGGVEFSLELEMET
jgi:hypothetical protein